MEIIDTHSHIYQPQFDKDRKEMIDRAHKAGVSRVLLPNIDSSTIERMRSLVDEFPETCLPMMGLHPSSVKDNYREELTKIKEELDKGGYLAVGEIGIDLYWDKSTLPQQQIAFAEQINWAKEMDLPIVIHARNSFQEIFEVMDREYDERLRGVFHCFTGDEETAKKALSYGGFYLGIGGVLTFKNSGLRESLKPFGLDRLMVETDAPYLAPEPNRGKRNEPAYTAYVVETLAETMGTSPEEVARVTSRNARELFRFQ